MLHRFFHILLHCLLFLDLLQTDYVYQLVLTLKLNIDLVITRAQTCLDVLWEANFDSFENFLKVYAILTFNDFT